MSLTRRSLVIDFILPLATILLLSLVISLGDLDRGLAVQFYRPADGWFLRQHWFWVLLYDYGMLPGLMLSGGGLLVLSAGAFVHRLRRYWRPATFLLLVALLGPGLLVHAVGKDMWGRPRPVDTRDFAGQRDYHSVFDRAGPKMGKSFPSGHAAIGFFTMAPFFIWRRRNRRRALLWLTGGCAYGLLMGVGRMAQGGHYLTDILWSGYLVHLTGMLLYYLLHPDQASDD